MGGETTKPLEEKPEEVIEEKQATKERPPSVVNTIKNRILGANRESKKDLKTEILRLQIKVSDLESELDEYKVINKDRVEVMKEFYLSERAYLQSLELLKNVYVDYLKKALTTDEFDRIRVFKELEVIYGLTKQFVENVEKKILFQPKAEENFIEIVLKFCEMFKLYADYIKHYEKSNQFLEEVFMKKKKLAKNFRVMEKELQKTIKHLGEINFNSLLVRPIQRLPRIKLLLERVKTHTKEDTAKFEKITKACEYIENIVSFCNEKTKDFRLQNKLNALGKQINNIALYQKKVKCFCESPDVFVLGGYGKQLEVSLYLLNDENIIVSVPGKRRLSLFKKRKKSLKYTMLPIKDSIIKVRKMEQEILFYEKITEKKEKKKTKKLDLLIYLTFPNKAVYETFYVKMKEVLTNNNVFDSDKEYESEEDN